MTAFLCCSFKAFELQLSPDQVSLRHAQESLAIISSMVSAALGAPAHKDKGPFAYEQGLQSLLVMVLLRMTSSSPAREH